MPDDGQGWPGNIRQASPVWDRVAANAICTRWLPVLSSPHGAGARRTAASLNETTRGAAASAVGVRSSTDPIS
jgi:hypothetical protein